MPGHVEAIYCWSCVAVCCGPRSPTISRESMNTLAVLYDNARLQRTDLSRRWLGALPRGCVHVDDTELLVLIGFFLFQPKLSDYNIASRGTSKLLTKRDEYLKSLAFVAPKERLVRYDG